MTPVVVWANALFIGLWVRIQSEPAWMFWIVLNHGGPRSLVDGNGPHKIKFSKDLSEPFLNCTFHPQGILFIWWKVMPNHIQFFLHRKFQVIIPVPQTTPIMFIACSMSKRVKFCTYPIYTGYSQNNGEVSQVNKIINSHGCQCHYSQKLSKFHTCYSKAFDVCTPSLRSTH